MALIEVDEVIKVFGTGVRAVHALRGLSLRVEEGEFTAISGPSGSGKSTLLNLLGALDRPTRGSVRLEGVDIGALDAKARSRLRRDRIGFVFQSYNLISVQTALENATAVLALQGVSTAERNRRGEELLELLGLQGMGKRLPHELSGGQQQRVAVARAIASRPAVVLADEPTANLDSTTSEALVEVMRDLNEQQGTTFVFSTHDPLVMKHARRNLVMEDGRIAGDEGR